MISNLTSFLLGITALQTTEFASQPRAETSQEYVILIHGLGRTSLSMKRLEWTLTRKGYHVVNISYPSRKFCIEQLSEDYLHSVITDVPSQASRLHFVTHSMGGIILRYYLSNHTINNLGRMVMLAPPNQGSELADYFKGFAIGRWILGPGGCQLGTASTDLPGQLGVVDFDCGVIAGNRSLNPWFSHILRGDDDGKVSVESTQNKGVTELLIVPNSHTWVSWRSKTIRHVTNYLQTGHFHL